ncbi:peptidylprolyl isomerase A [Maribrevibacterium harenarium]|uniref:Peptidyl-prolyl cis-trans isomerase n=1 Tax=Maribrevibacterium harenarium TaxID=2589817 RepID=A0A501X2M4_9GAMM|nr:peptidylprolyl isomerase [Maribrevibacterium harenarium]TPE54741.1 peptidylprolyl isomerase A [Maribrevibacterium harenarium]
MKKTLLATLLLGVFTSAAYATEVEMITNKGTIVIDLNDEAAPNTVANFLRYVDEGFYSNTVFHRVIRGFMVQGGGFEADLNRKDTHLPVAYEGDNGLYNDAGTIAMARTQDPNSATSQFFINQVDNTFLNHGARGTYGYTVFGKVTQGMDVVNRIADVSVRNVGPYQNVPVEPVVIEAVRRVN